jgi:hypothetical protein
MKPDYYTQAKQAREHEHAVKQFLNSKGVNSSTLNYDNFQLYADAKRYSRHATVPQREKKQLHKFCKHWTVFKGDVKPSIIAKISKIVKHCAVREHNYLCKQRRLETRPVKNKKQ